MGRTAPGDALRSWRIIKAQSVLAGRHSQSLPKDGECKWISPLQSSDGINVVAHGQL